MDTILYNCVTLAKAEGATTVAAATAATAAPNLTLNADIQILTDLLTRINNVLNSELLNIRK
jgi:hypothetical protein